ncbi:MAG TPA: class I SAM-dependent methyltransferase [Candidatus Eisenbacteria bacterium]|nr:class I SAM-dependent methyltransferase [Candidatus Eisenbacteria bacterium]
MISQSSTEQLLLECISGTGSRTDLWVDFIHRTHVRKMVEIGVYRGDFAAALLERCAGITKYYMIDPWKHLDNWNKPANQDDTIFEGFFEETKTKTDFAAPRRVILRGKTSDVVDEITDGELDFAYIDGDHTLRGITIDLMRIYPKVKSGGFIGGDDFTTSVWEHKTSFEPTLVFPYAVYFAEAVGATIYSLPYSQFCLQKMETAEFSFVDLVRKYGHVGLQRQFAPEHVLKFAMNERFPRLTRLLARAKRVIR